MDNKNKVNSKLDLARDKLIEGVSRISDAFGINRFIVQLYTLLYLNAQPLSLGEIAETLGVSKGNVSINIRELEKWDAVNNIWIKGSRKDFYLADPDVKKIILNKIKSAIQKRTLEFSNLLEEARQILASLDGKLNEEETKILATYTDRLEKLGEINNLIASASEILNKFI